MAGKDKHGPTFYNNTGWNESGHEKDDKEKKNDGRLTEPTYLVYRSTYHSDTPYILKPLMFFAVLTNVDEAAMDKNSLHGGNNSGLGGFKDGEKKKGR